MTKMQKHVLFVCLFCFGLVFSLLFLDGTCFLYIVGSSADVADAGVQ